MHCRVTKTEEQRDGVIRHRRRVIPFFFVRQAHDVTRKEVLGDTETSVTSGIIRITRKEKQRSAL